MKCMYSENDVALYVEGDVMPAKAREIQAHLSVCTRCQDLAMELRESQAALKTLRQDNVSGTSLALVRSQVLAEIQAGVRPVWGRWVYALAGAVFVVVLAVGWMLEMRKSQVQEIVKSDPLPPPAAVPLTRGTVIRDANNDTNRQSVRGRETANDISRREKANKAAKANSNVPLREGDGRQRRQEVAHTEIQPEQSEPAKPLVVKLLTDDPNIVIYWLIDNTGGAL
jgi:hypothetical protein